MEEVISEIIDVILGMVTCQHDTNHDEDGHHHYVEYDIDEEEAIKKIRHILVREEIMR